MQAGIIGDRIIFAGDRFPRIHIYNVVDNNWEIISLEKAKEEATIFTYKNRLYIAGGKSEDDELSNELLIFDNLTSTKQINTDLGTTYISKSGLKSNLLANGGYEIPKI